MASLPVWQVLIGIVIWSRAMSLWGLDIGDQLLLPINQYSNQWEPKVFVDFGNYEKPPKRTQRPHTIIVSTYQLRHQPHSEFRSRWACPAWAGTSSSATPRSSWRPRRWRGEGFPHLDHCPEVIMLQKKPSSQQFYSNIKHNFFLNDIRTCMVCVLPLPVTP